MHQPLPRSNPAVSEFRQTLGRQLERWLSKLRLSRWTIGARIIAIVVALAVPLNLVIVAVVWHQAETASEAQRTSLLYTARSIAASVDAKLGEYITLAQVLGRSPALLDDNLDAFETEARRAFTSVPDAWVLVADLKGQQLINTASRPGEPLPVRNPVAILAQKRALDTGSIIVTGVLMHSVVNDLIVNIDAPVFKDGKPFRALAVCIRARLFLRLLNDRHIPTNWIAGIVDRQGQMIARVPGHDRYGGQPASAGWRKVKDQEGVFEFPSLEGDPIVLANASSAASGWQVGIAVTKAEMQAAAWNTIRWAAILGGGLSVLSLLFASVMARRITRPIAELQEKASALLVNRVPSMPPEGPPEVSALWDALKQSAVDRDRSDQALRESEARLRLALDAAELGIWRWEAGEASKEVHWDARCRALFGVLPSEAVTYEVWANAISPGDRVKPEANVARALDPADPHDETLCEYRVRHPDGTVRWVSSVGRAFFERDPAAPSGRRVLFMAGAVRDNTEQKQTQEALRQSEERFRGIFEHAGMGIAIAGLGGRFQSCNPAFSAMLGYSEEELRALNFRDLVHPEDRDADMTENRRLLAQEIPAFEIVHRYLKRDGKPIWVHKHTSLLRDAAGTPTNFVALVADMTDRHRHEEQIRLLMREVNHRSKNMLALVLAVARQTRASNPDDFIERFGERIQALAAAQDLLVKNEWRGVDLEELVLSQLAHFNDLIGTRVGLKGPPLLISASAAQTIGMALHELATNAGKYGALSARDGRVEVEWSLERSEADKETFALSWRETGGPAVKISSRKGFGSTVICALAEANLDAKVQLDFAAGGLGWRLQCPAANVGEASEPPVFEIASPALSNAPASTRPRVLVVEDEALIAIEIAHVLSEAGFDVIGSARTVAQALSLIEEKGCEVAVLDVNLGAQTSEPVALRLLASGTPFVALSGYSRVQHPPVFRRGPALAKPLQPELLITEIRRCLGRAATGHC